MGSSKQRKFWLKEIDHARYKLLEAEDDDSSGLGFGGLNQPRTSFMGSLAHRLTGSGQGGSGRSSGSGGSGNEKGSGTGSTSLPHMRPSFLEQQRAKRDEANDSDSSSSSSSSDEESSVDTNTPKQQEPETSQSPSQSQSPPNTKDFMNRFSSPKVAPSV